MTPNTVYQLAGKGEQFRGSHATLKKLIGRADVNAGVQVFLEQDLQGDFTGTAAAHHGIASRISSVVLRQPGQ